MKMPIDLVAVFQEAMDVDAARSVPITVSVLLDEAAPSDLVSFVRSSFASASPQARVSVNYFSDASAVFDSKSDMVVIAAGMTEEIGLIARRAREENIPTLVVTTMPGMVSRAAIASGCPIPEGDLVAPMVKDGEVLTFFEPVVISNSTACGLPAVSGWRSDDPQMLEPYALDGHFIKQLSYRMGEWIVTCFRTKRLAFAQAFGFVRRPLSMESVRSTSMQNAGVGLVGFIPGSDLPVMTLNQAKMVLQIAAAYGQPLTMERAKELAAVVGGGFACRAAARQIIGVVPALGWAVKATMGYAGTSAMGHAAVQYFEGGGNAAGVAAVTARARQAAVRIAEESAANRAAGGAARKLAHQAVGTVKDAARSAVRTAPVKLAQAVQKAVEFAGSAARTTGTTGTAGTAETTETPRKG